VAASPVTSAVVEHATPSLRAGVGRVRLDRMTGAMAARLAGVVALALLIVGTAAAPAGAHGIGGLPPTNFRTRVLAVTPHVDGLRVRAVDLGTRIELTNRTGHDIVVLGYEGEPYLRVGPRGVFENRRSPATYLNRNTQGTTPVPRSADAHAAPRWDRTGDGPTVLWHDHRTHWMGADDPPIVQREPGSPHLIERFRLQLRDGSTPIAVTGDLRWIPGPSPWPWIGGALALAVALALLMRAPRRPRRAAWATVGALAVLVAAQVVHVAGVWGGATGSSWSHLATSAYSIGGVGLAVVAAAVILRRGLESAAPLALVAGLFVGLAGGFADVTTLSRSQVPTTLPLWTDRLAVAVTIGIGPAIVVAVGLAMRTQVLERRRRAQLAVRVSGAPEPSADLDAMRRRQAALAADDEGARRSPV